MLPNQVSKTPKGMLGLPGYFRALRKRWKAAVTGFFVTYFPLTLTKLGWDLNLWGWALVFVGAIVPAGYLAWRDERRRAAKLEAENEILRLAKPRIGRWEIQSGGVADHPPVDIKTGWFLRLWNDGESAVFSAKYRVHEGTIPDLAGREWIAAWGEGGQYNRRFLRMEIPKGDTAKIWLSESYERSGKAKAELIGLRDDGGRVAPWSHATSPSCLIELELFSSPGMLERWVRRFRIDGLGVVQIPPPPEGAP